MGWIPDPPDPRDYTLRTEAILPLLQGFSRCPQKKLPTKVDLRYGDEGEYFFHQALDQGKLNCSSTSAVLSLFEYFERRIRGKIFEGSDLFLYQVARKYLQTHRCRLCNSGANLRTAIKIFLQFGAPPEEFWPYDPEKFDIEPDSFLYALAESPPLGISYVRLDEPNTGGSKTWQTIKSFLAAGFPIAFGFPVPASLTTDENIPYRRDLDSFRGGQAAVAIGYEKHRFGRKRHGLQIHTSWGRQWGDHGNGWLPVSFILNQLARDFWTFVNEDWLVSAELSQPSVVSSRILQND